MGKARLRLKKRYTTHHSLSKPSFSLVLSLLLISDIERTRPPTPQKLKRSSFWGTSKDRRSSIYVRLSWRCIFIKLGGFLLAQESPTLKLQTLGTSEAPWEFQTPVLASKNRSPANPFLCFFFSFNPPLTLALLRRRRTNQPKERTDE